MVDAEVETRLQDARGRLHTETGKLLFKALQRIIFDQSGLWRDEDALAGDGVDHALLHEFVDGAAYRHVTHVEPAAEFALGRQLFAGRIVATGNGVEEALLELDVQEPAVGHVAGSGVRGRRESNIYWYISV